MIIIPIENKVDWRNPPLATLALIFTNVLVFFLYQYYDDARSEAAFEYYQSAELLEKEAPLYREYLADQPQNGADQFFLEYGVENPEEIPEEALLYAIFYDREFDAYVEKHRPLGENNWQSARKRFEELRSQISFYAYGLSPAEPFSITQLTALFLHGDVGHLFGNMLFLFIFGFALEIALGRLAFLGIYLLSGFAANLLHIAFNLNSLETLVGASGAISGLMGMYIAVYGLRKITFFYTVIFYADYFRAPALIVFPVWLLKELYGVLFEESNIAYWAHIGGLLAGFGAVYALKDRVLKIDWNYVDKVDEDAPLRDDLSKVDESLAQMNFTRAKQQCQRLLAKYPERFEVLKKQFDIWKLEPAQREFHLAAFELFKLVRGNRDKPMAMANIAMAMDEYLALAPKAPALNEKICLALTPAFIRNEQFASAGLVLDRLLAMQSRAADLPQWLFNLANILDKRQQKSTSDRYRKLLLANFPSSEPAQLLARHR